jgi:hypothetical protein
MWLMKIVWGMFGELPLLTLRPSITPEMVNISWCLSSVITVSFLRFDGVRDRISLGSQTSY